MKSKGNFLKQVALLTAAFLSIASAVSASDVFLTNVNLGMQEGKKFHKFILVDIYTTWCGWCKRLDRDTFSNPELARYLSERFISIKANAEDGGDGQKLAGDNGVNGYPCALVFDPDGKLIGRIVGYKDAEGYKSALQNIIESPRQ